MSIHVALHHRTTYNYHRAISLGAQTIRLRPAPHCRTKILSYALKVEPTKQFLNWQQDSHANYQARLVFPEKTDLLDVTVDLVAEMAVYNPFDFFLEPCADKFPHTYEPWLKKDLAPYLECMDDCPKLQALVDEWKGKEQRMVDFLVAINIRVHELVGYTIRMEPGVQTPEETLTLASGSCRDSGWLLVNLLRSLGFAARFVSGYLIQLKPDVKSLDGPSGTEVDFTDLHAWCEVFLPGAGWIGLDPTSGLFAGEGHIPLACTPDPFSAAPVSGTMEKCESTMHHEMKVTRIHESPRVTKPYTEEQWERILASGRAVDARLVEGDVRLTMGGEPTFVSVDDPDGDEWNFTANGVRKRELAGELIKRLREKYADGVGFLHYGQGKWYPGEQLPRWSLGCWWRKDGVPFWKDAALIADESVDYKHGEAEARLLADRIMHHLGVDPQWLMPAHEDIYYYIWRERKLPINVDPLNTNLEDKLERDRIRRIFEQGLGATVGYCLPIERTPVDGELKWVSGPWFLRRETLYLVPGDSPMGLRLPLDSLPWVTKGEYPYVYEVDPMAERPALPPRRQRQFTLPTTELSESGPSVTPREALREMLSGKFTTSSSAGAGSGAGDGEAIAASRAAGDKAAIAPVTPAPFTREPAPQESASWILRSALCVEPRQGRIHIFMPPVKELEDYIDLVGAIEDAVTELGIPVIIEGTAPPYDPRVQVFKVTPDPGVIEVNMHPSSTWDELVEKTDTLYHEAHLTRLGTEKFMVDGRHTGTGGGNHIIIGGATPADSPLLRRPDLLKSLLGYWQNHPSLSYLFTGLFIGPTSQAPRIDEARNDSLYELGLAFDQVPGRDQYIAPWVVDRIFRNLLVDATGNTHRSEFCIDKLFAPESSTGRLGLLELRSYEMPPHSHMSLSQHLMLRALVAKFWEKPYTTQLVRWGTDIHDRWMLPHFLWEDFKDVIDDLKLSGFDMEQEWFAPHFEFRFPFIGEFNQRGVDIELRTALEPWHVLGDEPVGGATVRYVDSSVERMQIKVKGMTDTRHVIAVNGRPLPLHPTGINGEFVCGVRYRAWNPPNALHPLIGVHAPLTFDLVDTWNQRSLGGCRYHVSHPGGLSYETFPVNAYEAESRRLSRFESIGHTSGFMQPASAHRSREFPYTLDLRA
jgi:uncharacterized protein (DUF2126 family)/transglutaminase-like putative cysteine protease